jgi:hypothetical protein
MKIGAENRDGTGFSYGFHEYRDVRIKRNIRFEILRIDEAVACESEQRNDRNLVSIGTRLPPHETAGPGYQTRRMGSLLNSFLPVPLEAIRSKLLSAPACV